MHTEFYKIQTIFFNRFAVWYDGEVSGEYYFIPNA